MSHKPIDGTYTCDREGLPPLPTGIKADVQAFTQFRYLIAYCFIGQVRYRSPQSPKITGRQHAGNHDDPQTFCPLPCNFVGQSGAVRDASCRRRDLNCRRPPKIECLILVQDFQGSLPIGLNLQKLSGFGSLLSELPRPGLYQPPRHGGVPTTSDLLACPGNCAAWDVRCRVAKFRRQVSWAGQQWDGRHTGFWGVLMRTVKYLYLSHAAILHLCHLCSLFAR